MDAYLEPTGRFQWERVVMLTALPPTAKLVALSLATFANRAGERIHPGNRLLAEQLQLSQRTVERQMDYLRSVGLIERTFHGSSKGRQGLADVYRLVVAEDLHERVPLIGTPDTRVVSSLPEHPTPAPGETAGNTRHQRQEHPTPATGTPDIEARSPDTGVAPTSLSTIEEQHHVRTSSFGASSAVTDPAAETSRFDAELAAIKALSAAEQAELLGAASEAVGDDWQAVVHYAAQQLAAGVA